MKKIIIRLIPVVMTLSLVSCAKVITEGKNDSAVRFLDAWEEAHKAEHPEFLWEKTELGSTILIHKKTSGKLAGSEDDSPYVMLEYTVSTLGNRLFETDSPGKFIWGEEIGENTDSLIAKQVGNYDPAVHYGPVICRRSGEGMIVGLSELVSGMREGERVWAIIPGWLQGKKRRPSAASYLANETGTPFAYDITLRKTIVDVAEFQLDSIKKYLSVNFPKKEYTDTTATGWGCYYMRTGEPKDETPLPKDTTVYINYTGRLLTGQVFDTTIADTAKVWNVYNASKTYAPVSVKWGETFDKITMNGSSVIAGFAKGLFQMHKFESGTVVFYSGLGYGESGNSPYIPPYSPLVFEISITEKPE